MTVLAAEELMNSSSRRSVTTSTSSSSTSTPGPKRSSPPAPIQRIAGVYSTGGGPHLRSGLTIDTAGQLHGSKA